MRIVTLFAILIGAWVSYAGSADAAQPPDVVQSDYWDNVAMGVGALYSLSSGIYNTAAGNNALGSNTSGNDNSAFGLGALGSNTTGNDNTAVGYNSFAGGITGSDNTAVGAWSLNNDQSGDENTAVGYQALMSDRSGTGNTAIGNVALASNSSGTFNVAAGTYALNANTIGSSNTAFGAYALGDNVIGSENTAIGIGALFSSTGNGNTALGSAALNENATGSNNIALGNNAGLKIAGSNNIDIGNEGVATDSGYIRIGTKGTQKGAFIAGIYTTKQEADSLPVFVNAAGRLSVGTSSERYKTAINPMGNHTERLQQLRPVTFHFKTDPKGAVQYGLIAEEVAKVYPELVVRDDAGKIQGVRYDELTPMLLNELQKQQEEIMGLKKMNESMQAAMEKLLTKVERVTMR